MSATTITSCDGLVSAISCRRPTHMSGKLTILAGGVQPAGDALEVFDQPQPQHDRDGPQLAEFQGIDRLIGIDERDKRTRVDLRVHMRDQLQNHVENTRQSGGRTIHEARQLTAVAARQVPPGHLDLLFDQIEVVQHPLGGRSEAAAAESRHGSARLNARSLRSLASSRVSRRLAPRWVPVLWPAASDRAWRASCSTLNNSARKGGSSALGRACRVVPGVSVCRECPHEMFPFHVPSRAGSIPNSTACSIGLYIKSDIDGPDRGE